MTAEGDNRALQVELSIDFLPLSNVFQPLCPYKLPTLIHNLEFAYFIKAPNDHLHLIVKNKKSAASNAIFPRSQEITLDCSPGISLLISTISSNL
jgi:hypothetical protein